MSSKPIAKRTVPCPLGTCCEDQWCPHAVQATLAVDSDGVPAVPAAPIVAENAGGSEEWFVHPMG